MNDEPGSTQTHRSAYDRRLERVVSYICTHIEDDLSLEVLSEVAGFSKFHFHRQFGAYAGVTVSQFVRLTRLRRAAYQLAFDRERRVIDVALDAGFAAPESFSRAFKDAQGQTPSEFRRSPLWGAPLTSTHLPTPTRSSHMNPSIVQFEETRVAVLEHTGPAAELMNSVAKFIDWRKSS